MSIRIVLLLLALFMACAHSPNAKERESAEIHYNLATEALRAGNTQEALREYDEALAIDDVFADAHMGRGLVLEFAFDKAAEAEREYRRAIELRPSYAEAHNNLGQLLARTGRLEEAIKSFDAALSNMLYKEPFIARCNKAQALYRLGRKSQGLAEFRTCLSINRKYCQGHRELGRIYLSEGRVEEAIESFGEYVRSCDKTADAHFQLGLAYLKAGDARLAREAFSKCESLAAGTALANECRRSRGLLQ
jgi:type IV pilus assembly protein PilF